MTAPYSSSKRKEQYPYRVTQKLRSAFAMADTPATERERDQWIGYFRFKDKTQLPANCLTFPSINCFMPFRDKIVPRKSSTLLGQAFTEGKSWPIIGHQKRFTTMGGFEIEIRVSKSDDTNKKDIIEILYPNPLTGFLQWYQITQNVNPLTAGLHEYYFDSWFDTNLNPAESLNLPRSVWVNGLNTIFSWTGGIAPVVAINPGISISTTAGVTWRSLGFVPPTIEFISFTPISGTFIVGEVITGGGSGATARIASVFPGSLQVEPISGTFTVSELITGGTSGATGATTDILSTPTGSSGNIVVNGLLYTVTGGWSTDTLLLSSTTGITVNNVATSQIQADSYASTIAFDVCRNNKNYMFYGSWKSRQLFMSNGFGHDSSALITTAQAVQNDLVVDPSPYIGTGSHVYRVTIDSVNPPIDEQTFTPGGAGNLNGGVYNTSGYSGAPGVTNDYSFLITANLEIVSNTVAGVFTVGERIVGAGSLAQATIIFVAAGGGTTTIFASLETVGGFNQGEVITGASSNATATIQMGGISSTNAYIFMKNGVKVIGPGLLPQFLTPITLVDGLTIQFPNYFGQTVGDSFNLKINQGGSDTFQWQVDGATPIATHVAITGGPQSLSNGLQITFVNKTGHTLGDYWEITANQSITKAWTNFYYTLPVRKPGEGYIYQLQENFWTMAPQEAEMYVNTQYGRWFYIDTILSANQQNETVSLTPLKQSSMSKVIFPYMISSLDNDLIFVTTDKKLDLIGRKQLVQLPQISSLSQPVQFDFDEATFLKGSMEYWNKTLWITTPKEGAMFCYDEHPENKYWQPPQIIPENGILSIVGNTLISHSSIRNQTFTLFNGTSGDTQENFAFTVRARRPYDCKGQRWNSKNSNMSFVEGYITGAPPMQLSVIQEVNGCKGIFPHNIDPVVCIPPDRAPLGEGEFGSHQMGSDSFTPDAYFQEIYQQFKPILSYYFYALELSCRTTNHSYEWLSFELNEVAGNTNNMPLKNQEPTLPALP